MIASLLPTPLSRVSPLTRAASDLTYEDTKELVFCAGHTAPFAKRPYKFKIVSSKVVDVETAEKGNEVYMAVGAAAQALKEASDGSLTIEKDRVRVETSKGDNKKIVVRASTPHCHAFTGQKVDVSFLPPLHVYEVNSEQGKIIKELVKPDRARDLCAACSWFFEQDSYIDSSSHLVVLTLKTLTKEAYVELGAFLEHICILCTQHKVDVATLDSCVDVVADDLKSMLHLPQDETPAVVLRLGRCGHTFHTLPPVQLDDLLTSP